MLYWVQSQKVTIVARHPKLRMSFLSNGPQLNTEFAIIILHFPPQARGSPDGAVPAEEAPSSASDGSETTDMAENNETSEVGRVELPAERLLHARAGWLQRRGMTT